MAVVRYYGELKLEKNLWLIKCEPHVRLRLKRIFYKINKSTLDTLEITDTVDTCKDLDWVMQRYPMEMTKEDENYLASKCREYNNTQEKLERILHPNHKCKPVDLKLPLRNYQLQAVEMVRVNKRLLVADDVGLGKTAEAIGVMASVEGALPALVVCQTHLPFQWKGQIEKFAPNLKTHIIPVGPTRNLPEADVYICPYSRIAKWEEYLSFCKSVAFDEVQELRRSGSKKYKASQNIAQAAEYVSAYSATPIYNYGGEIYNILEIIKPECLGGWYEFSREWCASDYDSDKARVRDPKALGSYLRENYLMIRRTREEVKQELPEVNKIVHAIDYDQKKAKESETLLKTIASRLISGELSFVERGMAARELDVRARYITGMAKAESVAEYVKIFLENGERVLLAGWHRDVYDVWKEKLRDYNPVMYTGSETANKKEKAKQDFIDGKSLVMFISLRSGVGLDGLQDVCSVIVLGELDWSHGVHHQIIGRLHRPGQKEQVTAIFLVSNHGTDPLMIDLLGLKASQSEGIVNTSDEVTLKQSSDNRIKELARRLANNV